MASRGGARVWILASLVALVAIATVAQGAFRACSGTRIDACDGVTDEASCTGCCRTFKATPRWSPPSCSCVQPAFF